MRGRPKWGFLSEVDVYFTSSVYGHFQSGKSDLEAPKSDCESMDHLFLHCLVTYSLWCFFKLKFIPTINTEKKRKKKKIEKEIEKRGIWSEIM